jgi:hypothetical protein
VPVPRNTTCVAPPAGAAADRTGDGAALHATAIIRLTRGNVRVKARRSIDAFYENSIVPAFYGPTK